MPGVTDAATRTDQYRRIDSAVGGKTGINTEAGKNLYALFTSRSGDGRHRAAAHAPERQFRAGYAEVVKYGLLGDANSSTGAKQCRSSSPRRRRRRRHAVQAAAPPRRHRRRRRRETAKRALLNLGHTFGHALEAAAGYSSRLLHGEAVAIGMAMAFRFSAALGLCSAADADSVARHLARSGLPVSPRQIAGGTSSPRELLDRMHQDKKTR